jgi:hypothetical protein
MHVSRGVRRAFVRSDARHGPARRILSASRLRALPDGLLFRINARLTPAFSAKKKPLVQRLFIDLAGA